MSITALARRLRMRGLGGGGSLPFGLYRAAMVFPGNSCTCIIG